MRIFQVCADPGIPPDGTKGASVHLRAIAGALRHAGHEVITFTAARARGSAPAPGTWLPLTGEGPLHRAAGRLGPPDLVYERYALGHEAGLHAARSLGCPFVLKVNAPLVAEATRYRPGSVGPGDLALEDRLFAGADLVVAVSEPLRRHVAVRRGDDQGTAVVWNGCELDRYPMPAPQRDGDAATLVFLGHPKPWHGAQRLPEMLVELRRRGHSVRLVVIGGGPGADELYRHATTLGVGDWVDITGPLTAEAVADQLMAATVAVAPYPPEPFFYFCPLKVVECLAAGLPVVSVAQGDLPAMVGAAGVLVAPGDEKAFVDETAALLADGERRRIMGRRAWERARVTFSWDRAAAAILTGVSPTSMAVAGAPTGAGRGEERR